MVPVTIPQYKSTIKTQKHYALLTVFVVDLLEAIVDLKLKLFLLKIVLLLLRGKENQIDLLYLLDK